MTEAMPQHIEENFIYKKLWNDIHNQDRNVCMIFTGDVGSGKSTGALKFCSDLDETFGIDRVCFTIEDFLSKARELKPGQALVMDESTGSEDALDSRNSLTGLNKMMSFFSNISRSKRLILVYCTPLLSALDKRIKTIGVTALLDFKGVDFQTQRSRAVFYWSFTLSMRDRTLTPKPRMKNRETGEQYEVPWITIGLPAPELIEAYKLKKNANIDKKLDDWVAKLKEKRDKTSKPFKMLSYYKKAKKILPKLRNKDGKIMTALIEWQLRIPERNANKLRIVLESEEESSHKE